jgi:hypothetical protein
MTNASHDRNAAAPLAITIVRSLAGLIVGLIVANGLAYLCYRVAFAILYQMNEGIFVDFPTGWWVLTIGYGFLTALLGGLTAAWIAGRRPALHGILIGIALAGFTAWTWKVASTGEEPKWFFASAGLVALAGGAAGGALRALWAKRSPGAPDPAPSAN